MYRLRTWSGCESTSRMPSQSIFYTFWTNYGWVSDILQLLSIRLRISSLISAILQLISNRLSIPAFYWQYQPVCSFFLRYLRVCPYKWLHIVVCVSLCSPRTYHDLEWLNVKSWRHKYWNCVKNDDPGKRQKIQGFCLNDPEKSMDVLGRYANRLWECHRIPKASADDDGYTVKPWTPYTPA